VRALDAVMTQFLSIFETGNQGDQPLDQFCFTILMQYPVE
jgi:hypothetical protein